MIEFGVQSLSFQIRIALPLVHQSFVSHKRPANAGGGCKGGSHPHGVHHSLWRLLCGARRLFCLGSAAKIWVAPCSPNGPQPFCMAIGVGNGGLGRKFSWGKNTYVRRLHFCNRHFFWQQGFLKTQNRGFQVCFLPPQPCSSLLNGPVCCPQHPV